MAKPTSPQQLSRLLETSPPACILLIVDHPFLEELAAEMSIREEISFEQLDSSQRSAKTILEELAISEATVVLLTTINHLSEDDFKFWDENRSLLLQRPSLLLVADQATAERFMQAAPNIRSMIGGSVFSALIEPSELTAAAIEAKLQQLRAHFNKTDDQVIREAEAKQLDLDPLYVSWLIYLGRGDLVP